MVDACDRDKDGSVDYNEFLRFLRVGKCVRRFIGRIERGTQAIYPASISEAR